MFTTYITNDPFNEDESSWDKVLHHSTIDEAIDELKRLSLELRNNPKYNGYCGYIKAQE